MLQHHRSWCAFAANPKILGIVRPPEDIVLVLGTMKTSVWTVGAFLARDDRVHDFSVGGQVGTVAGARLQLTSERNESQTCQQRSGPHRQPIETSLSPPLLNLPSSSRHASNTLDTTTGGGVDNQPQPKDQCIFLRYYKIKYRKVLPRQIKANADPSSLGEDGDGGGGAAVLAFDIEAEPEFIPVSLGQALVDGHTLIALPATESTR